MKKILLFFSLFLITNIAFASTLEEVENHFQKGMQYGTNGQKEEAINEFSLVVAADSGNLPQNYYVETFSEAYFNMGLLYAQKRNHEKGIENLKKALQISPSHKRSLYYLSWELMETGEIAEAKSYYERAKLLGVPEYDTQLGEELKSYFGSIAREMTIQYQSFFNPANSFPVTIKGTFCGSEELVRDTLIGLEKYLKILNNDSLSPIAVELVRIRESDTIIIEKWMIGGSGDQKTYWIKYDFTPPEGFPSKVLIQTSDTELFS